MSLVIIVGLFLNILMGELTGWIWLTVRIILVGSTADKYIRHSPNLAAAK
jgi:hypothetical protein